MLDKSQVWAWLERDGKAAGTAVSRRPTQRTFARSTKRTAAELNRLAKQLASGDLSVYEFGQHFHDVLEEGHAIAAALGRQRAGDYSALGSADNLRAEAAMRKQGEYLARFADALVARDPRYWDDDKKRYDANKVASRARQYLGGMRGTANTSFVTTSSHDDLFDRVMLSAEHCATCPGKQGGPYTIIQVQAMGLPGDGSDECGGNCGCVLVRYDGVVGFGRYTDPPPSDLTPGTVSNVPEAGDVPVIDIDPNDPRLADWFVV